MQDRAERAAYLVVAANELLFKKSSDRLDRFEGPCTMLRWETEEMVMLPFVVARDAAALF